MVLGWRSLHEERLLCEERSLHSESSLCEERPLHMERFLCIESFLHGHMGMSLGTERPQPLSSPAWLR